MWTMEVDLSSSVNFVIQLSTVLLFSTFLSGFAIKKLMQIIKG